MNDALEQIAAQRVVPVLRSASVDDALETARACARGGMRVIELTRTTPDVERAVKPLRDDGLIVGVGTVTRVGQVRAVAAAGARFIVSFAAPAGMVSTARELGLVAIPGALTPTEVLRCVDSGAPAIKLFPARSVSPAYLRDLRAVVPDLRVVVTGGLRATEEVIAPWLDAGALAIGLGSELGSVAADGADEVERRARAALEVAARGSLAGVSAE